MYTWLFVVSVMGLTTDPQKIYSSPTLSKNSLLFTKQYLQHIETFTNHTQYLNMTQSVFNQIVQLENNGTNASVILQMIEPLILPIQKHDEQMMIQFVQSFIKKQQECMKQVNQWISLMKNTYPIQYTHVNNMMDNEVQACEIQAYILSERLQ